MPHQMPENILARIEAKVATQLAHCNKSHRVSVIKELCRQYSQYGKCTTSIIAASTAVIFVES